MSIKKDIYKLGAGHLLMEQNLILLLSYETNHAFVYLASTLGW